MTGMSMQIYCDGGSRGNPGPGASAFVALISGKIIAKQGAYLGITTNNQAEYQAVVIALLFLQEELRKYHTQKIAFFLDSELVVRQLGGTYRIRDKKLQLVATRIKRLEQSLGVTISYTSIPREKNKLADRLVNYVLDQHK